MNGIATLFPVYLSVLWISEITQPCFCSFVLHSNKTQNGCKFLCLVCTQGLQWVWPTHTSLNTPDCLLGSYHLEHPPGYPNFWTDKKNQATINICAVFPHPADPNSFPHSQTGTCQRKKETVLCQTPTKLSIQVSSCCCTLLCTQSLLRNSGELQGSGGKQMCEEEEKDYNRD